MIKCLEENITQVEIAQKAGTTGVYQRFVQQKRWNIKKTFGAALEELGYDVKLSYVKKEV